MGNEIILKEVNGEVLASSRDVAERFNKEHSSVLKNIDGENRNGEHINGLRDEILASGNPPTKYFKESSYFNRGKSYKEYDLTRDGFSLLVMGFTGAEALEWKLKYIDAFNKMEDLLKSQNKTLPTTYKEALIQLLETVEKNEQLEAEREVLLPKATYHDDVLNKDDLIEVSCIAKDLGISATKLNQVMFLNKVIYKSESGVWKTYSEYDWLMVERYADYKIYTKANAKQLLKWTEKGREWIMNNYGGWLKNIAEVA